MDPSLIILVIADLGLGLGDLETKGQGHTRKRCVFSVITYKKKEVH